MFQLFRNSGFETLSSSSRRRYLFFVAPLRRCVRLSFCFLAVLLGSTVGHRISTHATAQRRNVKSNPFWVVIDTTILRTNRTVLLGPISTYKSPPSLLDAYGDS